MTLSVTLGFTLKLSFCYADDGGDTCADSTGKIAFAKIRPHYPTNNLIGDGVCQRSFKSVTDFNPYLAIGFRDDHEDAVITPLFSEFIFFCDLKCVVFDTLVVQSCDEKNDNLIRCFLFKL